MALADLQQEWLDLFWKMREMPSLDRDKIAAPFVSYAPPKYVRGAHNSILYVGKATDGCWERESFLEHKSILERRSVTTGELADHKPSAFWLFAESLGLSSDNVIWTNLFKIGVLSGNPNGPYADIQSDLAKQTLWAEISEFQPALVMFVTGNKYLDFVTQFPDNWSLWMKDPVIDMWWQERTDAQPAFLWTGHPQGKSSATLRHWRARAEQLLNQ